MHLHLRAACALLLVAGVSTTTSCARIFGGSGAKIEVPEMDTPREQAEIASRQFARANQTVDEKLRREEMQKAVKAFDVVIERFPLDRTYTPASRLLRADLFFQMDKFKESEDAYREVISLYPDIADIHAGALYGLGQSLYEQKRFREGKEAFRQLLDQYQNASEPSIRDRVRRARLKYEQINSTGDEFFTRSE